VLCNTRPGIQQLSLRLHAVLTVRNDLPSRTTRWVHSSTFSTPLTGAKCEVKANL